MYWLYLQNLWGDTYRLVQSSKFNQSERDQKEESFVTVHKRFLSMIGMTDKTTTRLQD